MLKLVQNIENISKFLILLVVLSITYIGIFFLGMANVYVLLGVLAVILAYLFKEKVWVLLAISIPTLVFGAFLRIQINPSWVYESNLAEILILISFSVLFFKAILDSRFKLKFDAISAGLFVYLLLSLISFFQIIDFRLFIYGIKIVILSFLSYLTALNLIYNKKRINSFIFGIMITVFILSLEIFYKFYQTGLSLDFFFNRNNVFITLGPIATTTAILVMMLPLLLAFYVQKQFKKSAPFILIVFLLGSLAVFLSLGKGAIFSLFVALIFLFIKFKEKRIAFALLSSVSLLTAFLFFFSFFEGLFYRIGMSFMDVSTKFRLLELEVCYKIISENFWLGVGAGQQMIYYTKYLYPDYNQLVNNFFLQSFIDLGLIGAVLMIGIFVLIVKKIVKIGKKVSVNTKPLYYGFIASFIAVLINGQVEVTLFAIPYAIAFWLSVGVFSNLDKYESN